MSPNTKTVGGSTVERWHKLSSDDALLSAAQSGDAVAFGELSGRYSRRILYRLYRMLGTWEEAEDVLQESLLRAFVHLPRFQARSSFSIWMTRIAINAALMALRKRRLAAETSLDRAEEEGDSWWAFDIADNSIGPEAAYAAKQSREILQKVIRHLSRRDRNVVELYYIQELSLNEVADSLGISPAAAKSRLLRARRALRMFLTRRSRKHSLRYLATDTAAPKTCRSSRPLQELIAAD